MKVFDPKSGAAKLQIKKVGEKADTAIIMLAPKTSWKMQPL